MGFVSDQRKLSRKISLKFLIFLAIFFLLLLVGWFLGIRINTSPSMPLGVYIKKFSAIQRGDIVAVCVDTRRRQFGLQRGYLKFGFGCDGVRPLIKQIIAVPGDQVELTDQYLRVNQTIYFYRTFYQDSHGNPLPVFPRGIYQSQTNYWLLGTHDPHSWDSRYWGPVDSKNIIENLHPLFT